MKRIENPFVRITVPLIAGILLSDSWKLDMLSISYLFIFLILLFAAFILLSSTIKTFGVKVAQGLLGILSFTLLGLLCAQFYYQLQKPSILPTKLADASYYTAIIHTRPTPTAKTKRYKVEIQHIRIKGRWQQFNSNAILYLHNGITYEFDYGDKLLIKGAPTYLEEQKNPYAFNYALYLHRRGIYLQDFVGKKDFVLANKSHSTSWRYLSQYAGDYFEDILSAYISTERELNMIKAMLLGRRDEITPEMEYVYETSGTAHVLAVSGLHVGIIYLIFSYIFRFLDRGSLRFLYHGVALFAIWSFAFITGMSPSVQRAATMFSFVIVGKLINRDSSIYNTILASAFCILIFSPNLIFSVSFQLSYAAVIGIVYLYQKIYGLIYIKYKALDFFWKITVVSLAAQLATFPISIYYFNQFPSLFLLTNLAAIPTAILVVSGGFMLFVTSMVGIVATIIGSILKWWTFGYNEILILVSNLSFSSIDKLYLKPAYVWLIVGAMILLLKFIFTKKMYFFGYFSIVLIVLAGWMCIDHYQKSIQREIIFFHLNNKQYYDIYIGNTCYTNIKSSGVEEEKEVNYTIVPSRTQHLIKTIEYLNKLPIARSVGKNTLIYSNNVSILILNEFPALAINRTSISIDYLVLGKDVLSDFGEIKRGITFKNLILDCTINSMDNIVVNKHFFGEKANIYSLAKDGAYRISL